MSIATIAQWDWPDAWPELTVTLLGHIRERQSADLGAPDLGIIFLLSREVPEPDNDLPFLAYSYQSNRYHAERTRFWHLTFCVAHAQ